jgi:hypothetical protein
MAGRFFPNDMAAYVQDGVEPSPAGRRRLLLAPQPTLPSLPRPR